MYEHYRGLGLLPIFFFPIVYISLCMVMFNLFLAILIDSFLSNEITKEADSDDAPIRKILKFRYKKVLNQCSQWQYATKSKCKEEKSLFSGDTYWK